MRCWYKKLYYVRAAWKDYHDGGGRNFIATPSLQRAIRMNKRLKLSVRQIDVRIRGKRPFVLRNSWL
jgi:hypothetical protein